MNYGFVAGTVAGDGEPVDAYVLGVDAPVAAVTGTVVAVVERVDDVEDKLVVAVRARGRGPGGRSPRRCGSRSSGSTPVSTC